MPFFLIMLAIQVALFVAQALLTPSPKFENARPKPLGDFSFPTADESRSVPIIWGTADLKGPNVIWYGNLKVIKIIKKIKGGLFKKSKKVTVGFRYFIGMDLLLGYGPLSTLTRLEISDRVASTQIINLFAAGNGGALLNINKPVLLGGKEKGGGVVGNIRVYAGLPNQLQNGYLQGQLGVNIPGYVDVAHAVAEQIEVGESESIGQYIFRVTRFPANLGLTGLNHIVSGDSNNGDANPAEVIFEILTNDVWGLNLAVGKINVPTFVAAGNTLFGEGNGFSLVQDSLTSGGDLIKEVLRQIDAVLYEDSDGVFHLKLIREDYVFATLPIFNETNVKELNSFSRGSWSQTQNHVNITYSDRNKDFISTGAMAQDIANVRIQGKQVRADQNFPGVKSAATAARIASRELKQLSFPLVKITFTANRQAATIRPGDVVRFSWALLGIVDMVIRISKVDLGDLLNGNIELEGAQDIFRLGENLYAAPQDTGWVPIDNTSVPFVDELVRSTPRIVLNTNPDDFPDPTIGERILSLAKRPDGAGQVVQYELFVDSGNGFEDGIAGSIGLTPAGTLLNAYPAATADIEASDLLKVENTQDYSEISDEPAANIGIALNLAVIEGSNEDEDEIIGWEQVIDNGTDFTLRNVHRGLMDTQARDHAIGARIWHFTDGRALSEVVYGNTSAIIVKNQSETTKDNLNIALATARPLTFNSRILRPHHPANLTVSGTRLPILGNKPADLSIAWGHRINDETFIEDANIAGTIAQDTDVEYDLEFRNAVTQTILRQLTLTSASPPPINGTWLSYLYTQADLQADTSQVGDYPLELRMQSRLLSSGLTSAQQLVKQFNVDMGGALVRAIDLNGTDEYLARTSNLSISMGNTFAVSIWVRPRGAAGGNQDPIVAIINSGGDLNRFEILLDDDQAGGEFRVRLFNNSSTLFKDYGFGSYTVDAYTLLTVVWNGTDLTVYQNAVEDTTPTLNLDNAGTMTSTARQVIVGVDPGLSTDFLDGLIHSIAVWDTARTAASITAEYNGGSGSTFNLRANSGNYVDRDALKHLWDFRDSTDIGGDFGNISSGFIDIDTNSQNIDGSDLSTTVPV